MGSGWVGVGCWGEGEKNESAALRHECYRDAIVLFIVSFPGTQNRVKMRMSKNVYKKLEKEFCNDKIMLREIFSLYADFIKNKLWLIRSWLVKRSCHDKL